VPTGRKFDGYRLHARIVGKRARLLTRTGLDWTPKYEAVAAALEKLPARSAYIDGELCAIKPDGTTSFSDLQASTDRKDSTQLVYFAFDLLFIDGKNLTTLPLLERKDRLKTLLQRAPKNIYFVDHVTGNGQAFYNATCKHEAEGIVSKRVDAPYKPGDRGIWRKTKCINEDEFVVVGFTNPEGRRPYLGALLLGYYTPAGDLIYAGRAGTGMNEAERKRLHGKLKPLETKTMTVARVARARRRPRAAWSSSHAEVARTRLHATRNSSRALSSDETKCGLIWVSVKFRLPNSRLAISCRNR
jgi:DNA ligase D-like protein (predicted ligase)